MAEMQSCHHDPKREEEEDREAVKEEQGKFPRIPFSLFL